MDLILKIDPEFQEKIPPLTDDEFKQLEENIVSEGEVREAIVIWNSTIVDGHNRWKIICKHPDIKWSTVEMNFSNKWEAFDWMYKNQLGRRNLTSEQKAYMIGKQYEARKKSHGGDRKSEKSSYQNDNLKIEDKNKDNKVNEQIAKEHHIGSATVSRSFAYAKGIDAIREHDREFAESILNAENKVAQTDVMAVGQAKPSEQEKIICAIKTGLQVPKQQKLSNEERIARKKEREELKAIANIANELFDENRTCEYDVHALIRDIRNNTSPFVSLLTSMIRSNKDICKENKDLIIETINETTIMKIREIEKEISDYE